jgi:exonuclease III
MDEVLTNFKLNLMSLNVKGIHSAFKRTKILNWLGNKHTDIILLQETYSTNDIVKYYKYQWKGDMYFSHGTNHSKGVAILIKNNLDHDIISSHIDTDGRYIILEMFVDGKPLIVANVYAPCSGKKEQLPFYDKFKRTLQDICIDNKPIIIGGDYNILLNPVVDRNGGNAKTNSKVLEKVNDLINSMDLVDIWRVRNPNLRKYTWRQRNPLIQSRLDFWLISDNLQDWVRKTDIKPAINTDHSSIHLNLESRSADKNGPSYWKFNDSLCDDDAFCKQLIDESKHWFENSKEIFDTKVVWDLMKYEIRRFTQAYSKKKAKDRNTAVKDLEIKLMEAEDKMSSHPTVKTRDEWEKVKGKLEDHYDHITQGIIVRSRANWVEKGEKNNKFFLNLENSNKCKSTIRCILDNNGDEISDTKGILREVKQFYATLYSKTDVDLHSNSANSFLKSDNIPKLSDDESNGCEGKLTYNECFKILHKMKNGKSPGNDGLSVCFYKQFWHVFGKLLVNSLNASYETGELNSSQKQGVITLILKKNKDKRSIKNYRPITLLNVDLKIGSKAIADRIAKVAPSLISYNQSAFVSGRYIGDAVRTVADTLYFTRNKKLPGILLCIDFEKAYDSIDHDFMSMAINTFNFGSSISKWIKTFYNNVTSCVMNNGMSTGYFNIERGLRQGDALSCQLFNLVIELLCIHLNNRADIQGIQVNPTTQVKLSCYADDVCIFVQDVNSASIVMDVLNEFRKCSSLKVNTNKTEAMWIGSLRTNNDKPLNIVWTTTLKILGIYFSYDDNVMMSLNYDDKIKTLSNVLNMWKQRDLTVLGKITIIKTFGLASLLYTSAMIGMPLSVQKKVNSIIYQCIWKGPDRVKRSVMCGGLDDGGVKMVDLKSKVNAQAVMWLKRLTMVNPSGWKHILLTYLNKIGGESILECNFNHHKLPDNIPPFYLNALRLWSEINFSEPKNANEACNQVIWNNQFILIGNESVYYSKFAEAGFHTLYDFIEDNGNFKEFNTLGIAGLNRADFIRWYGLINAIPIVWRKWIRKGHTIKDNARLIGLTLLNGFVQISNFRLRDLYMWYVNKSKTVPVSHYTLKKRYNVSDNDCKNIFIMPYKVTLDSRLRWLQYRITHDILPTNSWLVKIRDKIMTCVTFVIIVLKLFCTFSVSAILQISSGTTSRVSLTLFQICLVLIKSTVCMIEILVI